MRLPLFILALICALAAPAAAGAAKPVVGISDNRPAMLADPLFEQLGTKKTRLVVSYNAVEAGANGDDELSARVAPYLAAAEAQGIEVHVAFEHARGDAQECEDTPRASQCRLPTVAKYRQQVTRFLERFPTVNSITAWNEANHNTQPTSKDPRRAGQFARAAEEACKAVGRRCTVVTMDVLDAASNPEDTRNLDYSRTVRFIKQLKKGYGKRPEVCGIHNYADVNRFRTSGTRTLAKAMKCKEVWLTETGGFWKFASFWTKPTKRVGRCTTNADCQVKAMKYLFAKTIKAAPNIRRVYVYNFYSGNDGRFDAGIVKGSGETPNGRKRPAYAVVKKHI
jgi:hypothetical protein